MTIADVRKALATIKAAVPVLEAGCAELDRRAKIPSKDDGYPRRASGAQGDGSSGNGQRVETIEVRWLENGHAWQCSCGKSSVAEYGLSRDAHAAGNIHLDMVHATSATDYSDPTPNAALNGNGHHRPDEVDKRWATYEREIHRMARAATVALAQLAEPKNMDEPHRWCQSCMRIQHDDGQQRRPYLTPPWSKNKGKVDVGGRLAEPMDLCRFCWEHVAAEGALPPRPLLTEYLVKGRAPRKVTV